VCSFRSTNSQATREEPSTQLHGVAHPWQSERAADCQARLPEFPVALYRSLLDENKIEQYQGRTRKQAKSLGAWGFVFNQLNTYFTSDGKQLSHHSASQVSRVVFQCLHTCRRSLFSSRLCYLYNVLRFFFGVDKLYITLYFC